MSNKIEIAVEHALIKLCKSMPFSKISVKDICINADISKQSFYNHFKDKYDITASIYRKDICNKEILKERDYYKRTKIILENIKEKDYFYRNVLEDKGQNSLYQYIFIYSKNLNYQIISKLQCSELSPEQKYLITYHSGGWAICLDEWIKGKTNYTIDELTEIAVKNTPDFLIQSWDKEYFQ